MQHELRHGRLRLRLAPEAGGAVAGFWLDRPEGPVALLRPMPEGATDALLAGMFPMLPFANCIRDNCFTFAGTAYEVEPNMPGVALNFHGSGWRRPWRVEDAGTDRADLVLAEDDGVWNYVARQGFALGDTRLHILLSVRNEGARPMPFSFGLHPWFPRHGEARVRFAARRLWALAPDGRAMGQGPVPAERDFARARPAPRGYLNACYGGWSGTAEILWPGLGLALGLSADPVMEHLMLHVPADDDETFCLEPQSNAPCAFDALTGGETPPGVHVLLPGQTLNGGMTIGISSEQQSERTS